MTAEDVLVVRGKCTAVHRGWFRFKWKYDGSSSGLHGSATRSLLMSLIRSVRVQPQSPVCTRLFLKMFGSSILQHPEYAEGQLVTVLLETQEAMTVVSKMTKETLEEIDRIAAEAIPVIEKELGDVKFLYVDPSTFRLCESSGEEVSPLNFDPFDEQLTRKLGFSVVELGCCRALAAPGFGARVQVVYFLLYGPSTDTTRAVQVMTQVMENCR